MKTIVAPALVLAFALAAPASAYDPAAEIPPPVEPSLGKKLTDALVLRPLTLARVGSGAAVFLVGYPVGVALGRGAPVREFLIESPVEDVLHRPLGDF